MVPSLVRDALLDYRTRLERELPGRIRRVVLFGSWARDEAHEDSDVDVVVLIAAATSRERLHAIEIGAEVGFDHHLVIEPVVLADAQWAELERRERAFPQEVARDGIEGSA
jgi:predicted nucleotidyltransferase